MTPEIADLRKQVLELEEALRLTIIDKQDALARATAENQNLRDELSGKRESWYTRLIEMQQERDRMRERYRAAIEEGMKMEIERVIAHDRATKAEEGLREAIEALDYVYERTYCGRDAEWHFKAPYDPQRVIDVLARIKGLLPP